MEDNNAIEPIPDGYRLLVKGERTEHGDIGFMVWEHGKRRAWCELHANHVLNAIIETPGRCARKSTP